MLPPLINSRPDRQHKFKEVNAPGKMRGREADLDRIEGLVKPAQLTADAISDQTPRAQASTPLYALSNS